MFEAVTLTDAQIAEDQVLGDLIEKIALNHSASVTAFYDLTIGRVYGVALRVVGNPRIAEEVTSETYLQIWREADRFDKSRGRVLGWALVIARSRALDALRKSDSALTHPNPYELTDELTQLHAEANLQQDELLNAARDSSRLKGALLTLAPIQRQLIALAFFRGLTHAEIVEHTQIPLGTVKTHIRRGLITLRKQLDDDSLYPIESAGPTLKGLSL
jgi:RNA polymerase sigma factor (sigma-70 family)